MNAFALNDGCFREGMQSALRGEQTKRPWSIRILDRIFAKRQRVTKGHFCCDWCSRKWKAKVADGDVSFLR
jgi:hypothetical protein